MHEYNFGKTNVVGKEDIGYIEAYISSMGQTMKTQTKKRKSMNANTKAISVLGALMQR